MDQVLEINNFHAYSSKCGTITNMVTTLTSYSKPVKMEIKDSATVFYTANHLSLSESTIKPPIPPKPKFIPQPKYPLKKLQDTSLDLDSLKSLHRKLLERKNIPSQLGNFEGERVVTNENSSIHVTHIQVEHEAVCQSVNTDLVHITKEIPKVVVEDWRPKTQCNYDNFESRNEELDSSDDSSSTLMEKTLENCGDASLNRISATSSSLSESESDDMSPSDQNSNFGSQSFSDNPSITSNRTSAELSSGEGTSDSKEAIRARKAFLVAEEIMTSERSFVAVLRLLNVDFRQYLLDKGCASCTDGIPEKDLDELLSLLPNLQSFNEEILSDFHNRILGWSENPKIADIIVKKGPFLKLYTNYIKQLEWKTSLLEEMTNQRPYFKECVQEFQKIDKCGKIPISIHMLTPMQRITKYKELMKEYLKYLREDDADYQDALLALQIVKGVAEHANEAIRELDSAARLLTLQDRLNGLTPGDLYSAPSSGHIVHLLVEPGRKLVKEGRVMKLCRRGIRVVYLILLSDSLLYTTEEANGSKTSPLRLRYKLPLEGMRIDVPVSEDFQNEFIVISTSRSFTVRTSSAKERDEWIQSLRTAIEVNAGKRGSFQTAKTAEFDGLGLLSHALGKQAPAWIPDNRVTMCQLCTTEFTFTFRRHHCRACGKVVCRHCSANRAPLAFLDNQSERVCDNCYAELQKAALEEVAATDDNENEEVKERKRRRLKEIRATFRKGVREHHKRNRSRKPERLLEVSGGDVGSQMCGYLRHYSRKAWRQCWFVLKDKVLYEYRAPEDVCALSSLPVLGYSVTSEFENHDIFDGIDVSNAFQLLHPNQFPLIFYAESSDLAQK